MTVPQVLFLEDNVAWAKNYITRLQQAGFNVSHMLDAAAAVRFVHATPPAAMVIDIQLPIPRDVAAHDVADGNRAGLWFLEQVRDVIVNNWVPVFVLTNNLKWHQSWLDEFREREPALRDLLQCDLKINCSAMQLPGRLLSQVSRWRRDSGSV